MTTLLQFGVEIRKKQSKHHSISISYAIRLLDFTLGICEERDLREKPYFERKCRYLRKDKDNTNTVLRNNCKETIHSYKYPL
mmetsp:Transcript_34249/g.38984  ORF Transcript_34249/g.38984 Transcript_34249/m.38984 type:complete len:82 (+) Transcript_34249:925-1170(+)